MDHLQFLISNNILNFFSLTCYEAQSALDPVDQNLWRRMDFLSMWSHLHQKPPQFSRNGLVHIETWNLNLNPKSDEFQKRIPKKNHYCESKRVAGDIIKTVDPIRLAGRHSNLVNQDHLSWKFGPIFRWHHDVADWISILITSFECWCPTLM